MKIKKEYNNYYQKLNPSKELKDKINNKIFKKKYDFSLILKWSCFILIISIISIGLVFADEIKETINSYFFTTEKIPTTESNLNLAIPRLFVNNKKEINYYANIEEIERDSDNEKTITIGNLEKELQINFLKSNKYINNNVIYERVEKVNNKVASGIFFIRNAFDTNTKESTIDMTIQFNTIYSQIYKDNYYLEFGAAAYYDENMITKMYFENLNTDVYFFSNTKNLKNDEITNQIGVAFVYDDIGYILQGKNITRNIMIDIIRTFK